MPHYGSPPECRTHDKTPPFLGKWQIAELIEDDEVEAGEIIGEATLAVGPSFGFEPVDQINGVGLCMLTKRLERGQFVWPSATTTGRIALSPAQLAALLDGCEWRAPAPRRRPELAG